MSDSELAIVAPQTFPAPILIERAGPSTRKKFFEFFTVPIRNANTRGAYFRAWRTIAGYEAMHMIPKGQACWSAAGAKGGLLHRVLVSLFAATNSISDH